MSNFSEKFIEIVSERDILQAKFLRKQSLTTEEKNEFEDWLGFYQKVQGLTIEEIADAYLWLNKMVLEETKYFYRYGSYRYSSIAEVEELVYANRDFMSKYMIGLSCSDYLWYPHLETVRYFKEKILHDERTGGIYLEVGPGGGQYLTKAIESGKFSTYRAVDLSPASVELSNSILKYNGLDRLCVVEEKDFFELTDESKYDCLVVGEVLEHVERPKDMLNKIRNLLDVNGVAFITTVITAPTIDHIYLFEDEDSVLSMVRDVGFEILDYMCATANNVPMEMAIMRKMAIDIAMIVRRI